jgi:hypothetical protein
MDEMIFSQQLKPSDPSYPCQFLHNQSLFQAQERRLSIHVAAGDDLQHF